MALKWKSKRRRRGATLRLSSYETTTPVKMSWAAKPQPKPRAKTDAA
jgi:hypothetical protein